MRIHLCAALPLLVACATANAIDLYDGALGTAPETQGWLAFQSAGGTPTRVTADGKTTLDTTADNAIQAGYGNYSLIFPVNPNFPSLNRNDGIFVTLDMRVISESHVSNNRSGISLIALASDLLGIEVAFWTNEIWVQSGPDFMHAEGVSFDTTTAMTSYELAIVNDSYFLSANGNQILTGAVRDYSSFGLPYSLPNFIFLGDNTTSAAGSFEFSRLAVVPEPASLLCVLCVGLLLRRCP